MKADNKLQLPASHDNSLNTEGKIERTGIAINEVQLLLAEKRTSLATMRTGIAIFAIPISVLSVLIATSKYYDIMNVLHLLVPLIVINALLIILGFYLIIHAVIHIRRYERNILQIKQKYAHIARFID